MDPRDGKTDFSTWVWGQDLLPDERALLQTFLKQDRRTLEAGCAGGRILLELSRGGFEDLHGFDFVPEFIEVAKQRDASHRIHYVVANACSLPYESSSFEQLIYLQQILCFIESPALREQALAEAFRVLAPGGTAVFSFLCFEGRWRSPLWRAFVAAIQARRRILGPDRPSQLLPWLKKQGKPNFRVLGDRPPHGYWFRVREASEALARAGFKLAACSTSSQPARGVSCASVDELVEESLGNMIYFVVLK